MHDRSDVTITMSKPRLIAPAANAAGGDDFIAGVITRWDANADGMVTRQEFDNRPPAGGRGAPGGGRGGFGGGEQPENLEELSEKDVMNVVDLVRKRGRSGVFDLMRVETAIRDEQGAAVAFLTNTYVFPRRS